MSKIKHGYTTGTYVNGKQKIQPRRLYRIWTMCKQRCTNKNHIHYKNYGGRGIQLCERWLDSSEFFKDMEGLYNKHVEEYGEKQTQLDRINNDDGYHPRNCKFSTPKENQMNRRNTVKLNLGGVDYKLPEFSKKTGLPIKLIRSRLSNGWTPEEIETGKREKKLNAKGKAYKVYFSKYPTRLHKLDDRARNIIKHYLGINTKRITMGEIGDMFCVSKERIRQIVNNSMDKVC